MRRLLVAGLLLFGTGHLVFGAVDWELELTNGTDTALINSSGALVLNYTCLTCVALNPTPGVYTFIGSVGNYLVNVSTGSGSPLLPMGNLDLDSVDIAPGSSSGPLTIEWSEKGITTNDNSWTMGFGGTFVSGPGSTVSNSAYESNTNTFFAQSSPIGTITPTLGIGGSFSGGTGGSLSGVTAPYSLTEVVTLDGVGPAIYSGDASLTTAPEPASVVLLGSVVLMAVIAFRRKFMKKALVD
jgi:hypothetical protein